MVHRRWMMAALLVATPAIAQSMVYDGHSIDVDGSVGARRMAAVRGASYSIPGSTAQTIGKAQACLARADSGVGVVSVDPVGGLLRAVSRTPYAYAGQQRLVRSRWAVEATGGNFRVTFTDFADIQGEGFDESYVPVSLEAGPAWQDALAAVIVVEKSLLDCMYR
jgi:hypothetical protein